MRQSSLQRQPNIPLIIGSLVLLAILGVMIFPEALTDSSPYTVQQLRFGTEEGQFTVDKAPFSPSAEFPMGTDDLGRDIWSYIVYGTRTTILLGLLTALCQFLVAIPMALWGGMGHKGIKSLMYHSNLFFSAIPALLLGILILQVNLFSGLNRLPSILMFVCVLTAVAWPRLGVLLTERVETLEQQAFVMGETALGKKRVHIALENIIPHLVPEIVVLFFMEVARNLSMMMQLGLFGVFIGNLRLVLDSENGRLVFFNISYEPEWASMLSTSRTYLSRAPWTVIFPALAFFISVLGFNLFGEGLRNRLQQEDTGLISGVRNMLMLDWKQLLRRLKQSQRHLLVTAGLFLVLAAIVLFVHRPPAPFSLEKAPDPPHGQVVIGTKAAEDTAYFIADTMAELGMNPAVGSSIIVPYETETAQLTEHQYMEVVLRQGEQGLSLRPQEDFTFLSTRPGSTTSTTVVDAPVVDATLDDLLSMTDFRRYADRIVLLDTALYQDAFIRYFIGKVGQAVSVAGFLLMARDDGSGMTPISDVSSDPAVMLISRQWGERLKVMDQASIHAGASTSPLGGQGLNVVGIFEGNSPTPTAATEFIAVGLRFNTLDTAGRQVLRFNLELMKRLCQLDTNQRSLMFIFADGTIDDERHGIHVFSEAIPVSSHRIKAYIDLTSLGEPGPLSYSASQAPITRQFAWSLGKMLDDTLKREGIMTHGYDSVRVGAEHRFTGNSAANAMFWNAGIATLHLGGTTGDLEPLGDILLEVIHRNNY
jgi:peptide/nickel transport system permease protein